MDAPPPPNDNREDNSGDIPDDNSNNAPAPADDDNLNNAPAPAADGPYPVIDGQAIVPTTIRIQRNFGICGNSTYPPGLRIDLTDYENNWMANECLHVDVIPDFLVWVYKFSLGQVTAINQLIDQIRPGRNSDPAPIFYVHPHDAEYIVQHYQTPLLHIVHATREVMDLDCAALIPPLGFRVDHRPQRIANRHGPEANGHLYRYFSTLEFDLMLPQNQGALENFDIEAKKTLSQICLALTLGITCRTRAQVGVHMYATL